MLDTSVTSLVSRFREGEEKRGQTKEARDTKRGRENRGEEGWRENREEIKKKKNERRLRQTESIKGPEP